MQPCGAPRPAAAMCVLDNDRRGRETRTRPTCPDAPMTPPLHSTLRWLLDLASSDAPQADLDARIQADVRSSGLTDAQVSMATSTLTHALHAYLDEAVVNDGEVVTCSFCQRSRMDVRAIIAGPGVNICDQCVATCQQCLDGWAQDAEPPREGGVIGRWVRRLLG